jgi:hypothetical protein
MIKRVLKFYDIDFTYDNNEVKIEATNRHGNMFVAWLHRTNKTAYGNVGNYWEGNTDYGFSTKVKFKGIVNEFANQLINEVREYDERFYRFKSFVTIDDNGNNIPLMWDETKARKDDVSIEPTFQGSLTVNRF